MFLRNLRLYAEGRGSKVLRDRFREMGLGITDARNALASPDGCRTCCFRTADALQSMGNTGRRPR